MSLSLTEQNKKLIKALLRVGRWGNESEIVRYGLHLVAREVEAEQRRALTPVPAGVLSAAYRQLGADDFKEERAFAKASAYPAAGELG